MTKKANGHSNDINQDVFAGVVHQCYQRVYLTALALTRQRDMADDIAQETFLRAWLKRDLLTDSAMQIQPWLARIATNLSVDWLRRGQSRSRLLPIISLEDVLVEPADEKANNPRQAASRLEEAGQLEEAILALPDELRLAVLLHYGDDMTASDIARLNGEAASTVTRRLEKARGLLRQYLGGGAATSLAKGARKLRAHPGSLTRALALMSLAVAAPATTRAQLLQLVSDTPPPPLIDPVTSAAAAANIQETGFMNSILTKLGATKLMGAVAVAAALGGGIYGVNQLAGKKGSEMQTSSDHTSTARITAMAQNNGTDRAAYVRGNAGRQRQSQKATSGTSNADTETSRRRLSPQERLALLTKDTISSQPQVVKRDGETTGLLYFNLEIVDESGLPVKGADVMVEQILQSHRGSQSYGTTETMVQSDAKGIARVHVPRIYEENVPTDGAVIVVEHPEYASIHQIVMLDKLKELVLSHGETLKIFAYNANTSSPIRSGIRPTLGGYAPNELDWDWSGDGAIVIRKISPNSRYDRGKLSFYLLGEAANGDKLVSDYQNINFPRKTDEPLRLPMHKALSVSGRLSDNVPRPVKNGKVKATADSGGGVCGTYQPQNVDINEDGTFTITDLPPGKILIWALANGWCSVSTESDGSMGKPQEFILEENGQIYVLPMEETATVELTITDASGAPLPDLLFGSYPNISLEDCGTVWIQGAYGKTDINGTGIVFDLPPLDQVKFSIRGDEWEFAPRATQSGYVSKSVAFDLKPGETVKETVVVYPQGTTIITQQGDQITTSARTN